MTMNFLHFTQCVKYTLLSLLFLGHLVIGQEIIDLACSSLEVHQLKFWMNQLNTSPEMFKTYEHLLFRHCLRYNFIQLRNELPNPCLARMLQFVASKKDILSKEKLLVVG